MKSALVMLSGGCDSAVALFETKASYATQTVFFDYGQPSADAELHAARQIARAAQVPLQPVDISGLKYLFLGTSDLATLPIGFANGRPNCPHGLFGIASTYCVSSGVDCLVTGMHREDVAQLNDAAGYFKTWGSAIASLQGVSFEFSFPFLHVTKSKVIERGLQLGVRFAQTRSCTAPGFGHCGVCDACAARKLAFLSLSHVDPTTYSS